MGKAWLVGARQGKTGMEFLNKKVKGSERMAKAKAVSVTATGSETATQISIPEIDVQGGRIYIKGTTSLIVHAWDEKVKREMLDKQMNKPRAKKGAKNPEADFESSKYKNAKGEDCFPSIGFKAAIVSAARFLSKDVKMTMLRGALFIEQDLVPIKYESCVMREDMVRVGMGSADLRYRAEYINWHAVLSIQYDAGVINPAQIANLLNHAGFSVGIGEWRPERNGQFGRFRVVNEGDI